jgi:carbon monoxide dehydrogenase subunit G
MKIEERFTVPFPRERVWAFLHDIPAIAGCLPGTELTQIGADGHLAGRFSIRLGPVAAAFVGTAEIAFDEAAQRGEIAGTGSDRKSGTRAKGSVSFGLADEGGATRIDLVVDYALAGALAQFNRGGVVRDLAARLTAQFAENLQSALATATPLPAEPRVRLGGMLIRVGWERLCRSMQQLFRHG